MSSLITSPTSSDPILVSSNQLKEKVVSFSNVRCPQDVNNLFRLHSKEKVQIIYAPEKAGRFLAPVPLLAFAFITTLLCQGLGM